MRPTVRARDTDAEEPMNEHRPGHLRHAASNARDEALPPTLKRNAPLVPVDSAASRALVAVIAILTFLAALCAGGAELIATSSAQWRASVAREVTIQVRPSAGRDTEALVARAAALAQATPGVAGAEPYSKIESERLLEPWLGSGLDLGDLPVPRLIVVRLADGARPDFADLRRRLTDEVPGASLDDHGLWLARLSIMANNVVAIGLGLVALVLVATRLAGVIDTRGVYVGIMDV